MGRGLCGGYVSGAADAFEEVAGVGGFDDAAVDHEVSGGGVDAVEEETSVGDSEGGAVFSAGGGGGHEVVDGGGDHADLLQVDAGFWFVEEADLGVLEFEFGDFPSFEFAPGEAGVDVAVDEVVNAEAVGGGVEPVGGTEGVGEAADGDAF